MEMRGSFYGISMVPKNVWREYGYALLIIAGGDGDVSDPELEWLTIQLAEAVGISDEIIEDWEDYDFYGNDLAEVFSNITATSFADFSKLLIYDAVRMCSADDEYADEEKEKVSEAAALLKVSQESVFAIESLVEMERATDKLRMHIL